MNKSAAQTRLIQSWTFLSSDRIEVPIAMHTSLIVNAALNNAFD